MSAEHEINVAVTFIRERIPKTFLSDEQSQQFQVKLAEVLRQLYKGHWYPNEPSRASAYRSISCNYLDVRSTPASLDPSLWKAARMAGIEPDSLAPHLSTFTLWVDPMDVSYQERWYINDLEREREGDVKNIWPNGVYNAQNFHSGGQSQRVSSATFAIPFANDVCYPLKSAESSFQPAPQFLANDDTAYNSSCGSSSSSPSASPILSEEDESTGLASILKAQRLYLHTLYERHGILQAKRGASSLSRSATEFCPRSVIRC